jgi:hypothetical protein
VDNLVELSKMLQQFASTERLASNERQGLWTLPSKKHALGRDGISDQGYYARIYPSQRRGAVNASKKANAATARAKLTGQREHHLTAEYLHNDAAYRHEDAHHSACFAGRKKDAEQHLKLMNSHDRWVGSHFMLSSLQSRKNRAGTSTQE